MRWISIISSLDNLLVYRESEIVLINLEPTTFKSLLVLSEVIKIKYLPLKFNSETVF